MERSQRKPSGGPKYGLQLQFGAAAGAAAAKKKPQLKKPLPFSLADNDDEYTVEEDIARQASKKKNAHEVDVQIKQALEQDSNAFDYDGVYEQVKGQQARPIREDIAKREPKYIGKLVEKAKVRAVEHDIAYERRLAREREKEDHLYGDKETFLTGAYKKKLIEQGKWKEEERLREAREKAHEVAGKSNLSDFYRNLLKNNVAFGSRGGERDHGGQDGHQPKSRGQEAEREMSSDRQKGSNDLDEQIDEDHGKQGTRSRSPSSSLTKHLNQLDEGNEDSGLNSPVKSTSISAFQRAGLHSPESGPNKAVPPASSSDSISKEDALAAARERYLARKRQRIG